MASSRAVVAQRLTWAMMSDCSVRMPHIVLATRETDCVCKKLHDALISLFQRKDYI
jgi:hypothetical protein